MITLLLNSTGQINTNTSDTSQKVTGFGGEVADKQHQTTNSQCNLEQNYSRMENSLRYILMPLICFICALTASAQNLGITTPGTTGYPQTNIGNTLTESGGNAGNYLIFNPVTTTVPLNAISIRTYGSSSGTISVTIYNDNGSNSPGTKMFTEVAASVTANTLSTITIPATYLAPGKYWLAYDMNSGSSSANYITKSTGVTGYVRKSLSLTYGTSFPNNPGAGDLAAGNQDHISFQGVSVRGYAKATKAVLSTNGTFSSISFYSHAAGNARLAIFNDGGSAPSAKQWESNDVAVTAGTWTTVNISSGTPSSLILNAGTYWLAWQWNSTASGPSYTAGSSGDGNYIIQTTYGSFPSTWSGGTTSAEKWSLYATYSPCTLPTSYTVTGGGSYCSGGSGVAVGLSNSETGVTYQLFRNVTNVVGSPVPGITGSSISFGSQTADGSYTVVATRTTGGCTNNMTGGATVTVNALPSASVTGKTNISCYAATDGTITVTASGGSGTGYTFSKDGTTWEGSGNPYTFTGLIANVQYRIRVKDSKGCASPAIN